MRLYDDLSWLWPLWGDPEGEYRDWCTYVTRLIRQHALRPIRSLLNLGCGGGKNAFNLKRDFEVTGLDLSPSMLDLATHLNPECRFVQGDMRHCSLDARFDCVLIDDAISHMLSQEDLRAVFRSAFDHLEPGGVLVASADSTRETFEQNRTDVWHAESGVGPEGVEVVFVDNQYDPDPSDETYESTVIYLIREHGRLRIERDETLLGLFGLETWRSALRETGFDVHDSEYIQGGREYATFACVRPGPAGP